MGLIVSLLVSMSLTSVHVPSQPDGRPHGDGRIAGRVLTESGEAVDGAVVFADRSGSAEADRYSATTTADGGYVIEGLPPGRFRIFAQKAGYMNLLVLGGRVEGGSIVDVEEGGALSGIVLVMGRTGSIAGRVTRPDGMPVGHASVALEAPQPSGRTIYTGPSVLTDARGEYRLDGVPPATYAITATYSVLNEVGGGPARDEYHDWARTFYPAATEFNRGTPITLESGQRLEGIDITLQPLARYRLSGLVVAEDGSALRNVRVVHSPDASYSRIEVHDERFEIRGASGSVRLFATADTDKGTLIGLARVNATSSLDGVRIEVGPPAQVRGRVTFEGGAPSAERPMQIHLAGDYPRPMPDDNWLPDTASVGPDGRFAINSVIGEYGVTIIDPPPRWIPKEIRRGGRPLAEWRLSLAAGEVIDDLEIIMVRR